MRAPVCTKTAYGTVATRGSLGARPEGAYIAAQVEMIPAAFGKRSLYIRKHLGNSESLFLLLLQTLHARTCARTHAREVTGRVVSNDGVRTLPKGIQSLFCERKNTARSSARLAGRRISVCTGSKQDGVVSQLRDLFQDAAGLRTDEDLGGGNDQAPLLRPDSLASRPCARPHPITRTGRRRKGSRPLPFRAA